MKMKTIQKIQIPQNELVDDSNQKDIEESELLVKNIEESELPVNDDEDNEDVILGPLDVPYIPGKYEDFIGTYEKCVPDNMCHHIIKSMDYYMTTDSVWCEDNQFPDSMAGRFGYSIDLGHMNLKMDGRPDRDLNEVIFAKLREYIHIFGPVSYTHLTLPTKRIV